MKRYTVQNTRTAVECFNIKHVSHIKRGLSYAAASNGVLMC